LPQVPWPEARRELVSAWQARLPELYWPGPECLQPEARRQQERALELRGLQARLALEV
jgi:hypothetical protein